MNESELIDEVLELTLACQRGIATPEELARLERLLVDSPRAVLWYLRIMDDTLTLLDAAAARKTADIPTPATRETATTSIASPPRNSGVKWFLGRLPRLSLAIGAVLCGLVAGLWVLSNNSPSLPNYVSEHIRFHE